MRARGLMSLPFSARLSSVAGCLQCHRPPQQVINHPLGLCLELGESFVHVAAPEMRPQGRDGNVDGRANRGRTARGRAWQAKNPLRRLFSKPALTRAAHDHRNRDDASILGWLIILTSI